MTHYQKLGTMAFRFVGALCMLTGVLLILAYAVFASGFWHFEWFMLLAFVLFYPGPLVVIGFLLFAASRSLSQWICFDFERE